MRIAAGFLSVVVMTAVSNMRARGGGIPRTCDFKSAEPAGAAALMSIEQVPDIPMFRQNTAAFIHDLPACRLANVDGESTYVRIQVLTNAGALDRGKQLAVAERLTAITADAAGDPGLASRTWVLLTEAPDGGWGLAGHANTNEELVLAARAQLASLAADKQADV
jgi:phenylpyruvate tautomerase PptA (4-oxalocrotonate tautomerase family)